MFLLKWFRQKEHIREVEKAIRRRNRRIAHLSKKCYRLEEKVFVLETLLTQRAADVCPYCEGSGNCEYKDGVSVCVSCNGTGKRR